MKNFKKQNLTKKIIYIIIFLMLCNFIIPNYSYAVSTEGGGSLVNDIAEFVCIIPDAVINFLQNMFVSPQGIKMSGENYRIKYSPAIIFAGEIPAFNINFIDPMKDKIETETNNYISIWQEMNEGTDENISNIISRLKLNRRDSDICEWGFGGNPQGIVDDVCSDYYWNIRSYSVGVWLTEDDILNDWLDLNGLLKVEHFLVDGFQYESCWIYENTLYLAVFHEVNYYVGHHIAYAVYSTTLTDNELQMLEEKAIMSESTKTYKSIASILQEIVATWYNALRKIALVGLLSVLVYIGIRIILSSTPAKDKAKYKSMLKDWLVALCMLFVLHYVMNLTIVVVGKINEVIGASAMKPNGEDVLMSTVRNEIASGDGWGNVLAYLVIYCVLAVYTVIFSIQYIRRVIYIAFLTMIAPLITLTYPLDKIKDSKSQAFDMWLKDYIFFSLIQVLHLLLYYIFLSSSMDLANQGNWIYAIVAIGFLTKAEKLMKKMFGFEKSKSMGALAAGATGALVMNAINKIPHGGGAKSSGGAGGSAGANTKLVRTAMPTTIPSALAEGTSPSSGNDEGNSRPRNNNSPDNDTPESGTNNNGKNNTKPLNKQPVNRKNAKKQSSKKSANGEKSGGSDKRKPNIIKGATTLLGRYTSPVIKGALGILLSGTGAAIGFSAGVAQGDLGAAAAGLIAGGKAGYGLGQRVYDFLPNLVGSVKKTTEDIIDTAREGAHGEEYANNKKFDREFRRSTDYKRLKENNTNFSDKKIQQMLDEGISDATRMDKILKNNLKHPRKYSMENAIMYSQMAEKCKDNILYDNNKFIRFCRDEKEVTDLSPENLENLRKCIIDFK